MIEMRKGSGRSTSWSALAKFFWVAFILLVFGGCSKILNDAEMADQREQQAKTDLELLKPPMDINFEQPLTLEDVISIGLRNNLEVRIAKLDEEIADKETLAKRLQMLPGLVADARFEYRDKLRKSDVYNWRLDQDQKDYTVSELKDSFRANLTLTWNVLDTALAYVRSGASEMREQFLEQKRIRQAQQLALDIVGAYWQAAALEDALDYVHSVEKRLKVVKGRIDSAVASGDLDRMDAAEAELRLKELELTVRQLQANLSSARLELSQLMGFNQNVQYTLARPPIKPIVAALPHTKELDIDSLEEYALVHRPELYQRDIQVLIQKEETKAAILNLFPGLNFFAASHYDDNRLLYANTWNSVGAGVSWNLLDLPSNIARLQGTKKTVNMAEVERLMMTVGVITQVHISLLDYAIKVDRFRLLEETFQLAENLLDMAKAKNSAGRLPELAVTQRYLEEMAAKLRRDEAVVDMMVAHKRLCVSIGMFPQDCDTSILLGSGDVSGVGYDLASGELANMAADNYAAGSGSEIDTMDLGGASPYGSGSEYPAEDAGFTDAGAGTVPPAGGGVGGTGGAAGGTGGAVDPWSDTSTYEDDYSASRGWSNAASDRFLWKVQMGSFTKAGGPAKRIDQIKDLELRLADNRDARVSTKNLNGKLYNRVRLMGLTEPEAKQLAQNLKQNGMEYWVIPPTSNHW